MILTMQRIFSAFLAALALSTMLASCPVPSNANEGDQGDNPSPAIPMEENSAFLTASSPGETAEFKLAGDLSVPMVYAKDGTSISFPDQYDNAISTLGTAFFVCDTEFTNAMAARVFQWALEEGKLSSTEADHNGTSVATVKYGGRELVDLDNGDCHLAYDGTSGFASDAGYASHPLVNVSWYGAVMLCNWLTEMRDGDTSQAVYSGIDDTLDYSEISCDPSRTGYRLPMDGEWQYSARYLGTTEPTGGDLATERLSGDDNPNWTDGYYWHPYTYASGAEADVRNPDACRSVAVYSGQEPVPVEAAQVKTCSANYLGLYDLNGNVWEWEYTAMPSQSSRFVNGGSWNMGTDYLFVGTFESVSAHSSGNHIGFRICRTAR